MSGIRDHKYQKSNKALWAALKRLKDNQPISRELKAKSKQKVNRRTVEIEANMSSGALRNHPDVVAAINKYKDELLAAKAGLANAEGVNKHKTDSYRAALKKEVSQKRQYAEEVKRLRDVLGEQIASHHEVTVALFRKVPLEDREPLIKSLESKINVVSLHP